MSWATPEEKLVLVLESALRTYDEADRRAANRHPDDCGCQLCEWVEASRKMVREWREANP